MKPEIGKTYRISCIHDEPELQHMNYEGMGKCHEKCKGSFYEGLWLFIIAKVGKDGNCDCEDCDGWDMFGEKDIIEEVDGGIRL